MKDVSVAEVESSCEMGFTGDDAIYQSCLSCCDSSGAIKSRCEMGRGQKNSNKTTKKNTSEWKGTLCCALKLAKNSSLMLLGKAVSGQIPV